MRQGVLDTFGTSEDILELGVSAGNLLVSEAIHIPHGHLPSIVFLCENDEIRREFTFATKIIDKTDRI